MYIYAVKRSCVEKQMFSFCLACLKISIATKKARDKRVISQAAQTEVFSSSEGLPCFLRFSTLLLV